MRQKTHGTTRQAISFRIGSLFARSRAHTNTQYKPLTLQVYTQICIYVRMEWSSVFLSSILSFFWCSFSVMLLCWYTHICLSWLVSIVVSSLYLFSFHTFYSCLAYDCCCCCCHRRRRCLRLYSFENFVLFWFRRFCVCMCVPLHIHTYARAHKQFNKQPYTIERKTVR